MAVVANLDAVHKDVTRLMQVFTAIDWPKLFCMVPTLVAISMKSKT
jgi:hypothetical protein